MRMLIHFLLLVVMLVFILLYWITNLWWFGVIGFLSLIFENVYLICCAIKSKKAKN